MRSVGAATVCAAIGVIGALFVAGLTPGAALGAVPLPHAKLTVPEGGRLGTALAVDGDWLVIGAPFDDAKAPDAGAVHVYQRSIAGWVHHQRIPAWLGAAGGHFGQTVAISGDWLAVGAPREGHSSGQGWVYLYHRSGGTWERHSALSGPNHGASIALAGDHLLVADPASSRYALFGGIVSVYAHQGGSWEFLTVLAPSDAATTQTFGYCMDVDHDQAVIAAPNSDRAYVFQRHEDVWLETQRLVAANGPFAELVGIGCAIDGNFVALGTPNGLVRDALGDHWGRVAVYRKDADGWTLDRNLRHLQSSSINQYGARVDIQGSALVVSAYRQDDRTGAAYVYGRSSAGWVEETRLTPPLGAAGDAFALGLAVDARSILVGAPGDDDTGTDGGAVYHYVRRG